MIYSPYLNLKDLFEISVCSKSHEYHFFVPKPDNTPTEIYVRIEDNKDILLPDQIYQLSFGPKGLNGELLDISIVQNLELSKVYSTIIQCILMFLKDNSDKFLGLSGKNDQESYMYYRFITKNFDKLSKYFQIFAVKNYVRLLDNYDSTAILVKADDVLRIPTPIDDSHQSCNFNYYNHFIFKLIF